MMTLEVNSNKTSRHKTSHASDPDRNPRLHRQTAVAKPSRLPQCRNKLSTDREFVEQLLTDRPTSCAAIVLRAEKMAISSATVDRYLRRLSDAGLIDCQYGLYWRKQS